MTILHLHFPYPASAHQVLIDGEPEYTFTSGPYPTMDPVLVHLRSEPSLPQHSARTHARAA